MNQQERDALRALHPRHDSFGERWCKRCLKDWPCDTIKVLDAWEASKAPCQHQHLSTIARMAEMGAECPKCVSELIGLPLDAAKEPISSSPVQISTGSEPAEELTCEHLDYAYIENPDSPAIGDGYIGVAFTYCPKCGEKL